MAERIYATGGDASIIDLRDFSFIPTKANKKGGERYQPEDIEDQHSVGICTAISLTQNARKVYGVDFSDDFQYLLQKLEIDGNWNEGSSARSALKVGVKFGFLPQSEWKHTTIEDRKKGYNYYIKKLQSVSREEIERLKTIAAKTKLAGYANVPVDRDKIAQAIDESKAGVIARFVIGNEWYRQPIEPLRPPKNPISGHIVTICNYDGNSFRIPNTWGADWADKGTAYFSLLTYQPTEVWIPYYQEMPVVIDNQREQLLTVIALLKKLVSLLTLKKG